MGIWGALAQIIWLGTCPFLNLHNHCISNLSVCLTDHLTLCSFSGNLCGKLTKSCVNAYNWHDHVKDPKKWESLPQERLRGMAKPSSVSVNKDQCEVSSHRDPYCDRLAYLPVSLNALSSQVAAGASPSPSMPHLTPAFQHISDTSSFPHCPGQVSRTQQHGSWQTSVNRNS